MDEPEIFPNLQQIMNAQISDLQSKLQDCNDQDSIRKQIVEFQFDIATKNKMVEELKNDLNSQVQDRQLVKYRVFLKDYQENDMYIGAQMKQDQKYEVYPFGYTCDNQVEIENQSTIYLDRANLSGDILEATGFSKTSVSILLKFYESDLQGVCKPPQLFNVLNVIGFAEVNEGQPLTVHVIHSYKDVVEPQVNQGVLETLENYLSDVFSGDKLAVEWTKLLILSSINYREGNEVNGRILFNLFNISKLDAEIITNVISSIYQPSSMITLKLQSLTEQNFCSKRNLDTSLIEPGQIILPTNIPSMIIIDETKLETGQLNPQALQNIQYLQMALEQSIIEIDFTYSRVTLNSELLAFIVSDGKSFIFHNVELPLIPHVNFIKQNLTLSQTNRNDILNLISSFHSRSKNKIIPESLKDKISESYADMRKQSNEVNPQTLILLISMMKIYCEIENLNEVSEDHLKKSIDLWQMTQKRNQDFKTK